ncbi:MAG: hypothetical protein WBI91_10645, partial [Coriobacteriia bacterium]
MDRRWPRHTTDCTPYGCTTIAEKGTSERREDHRCAEVGLPRVHFAHRHLPHLSCVSPCTHHRTPH